VKHPDKSATVGGCLQECFAVPAADPVGAVGAGDAFAAGFLSAWLRGLSTERALTEAAAVAAFAVQPATDTDGLPTAAERDRWLAATGDVHR
jgi:2-dehydro-3-deoxygluconokinase